MEKEGKETPLERKGLVLGKRGGPSNAVLDLVSCCGGDVEKRCRLESMLAENPQRCVILTDALEPDQPILYVDRMFECWTGYTNAVEFLGKNCRFLQFRGAYATSPHPLVQRAVTRKIREALQEGKDIDCEILNFRRDGAPLINNLYMCPLHSDPQQPSLVTHYLGLARFRLAKVAPELLGPLPERPTDWLRQDTLSGDSGPIPVPSSWASGGAERDAKDWLGELGDRELSHLMGFLSFQGLAALGATCRRFRRLAGQDFVWKQMCQRVWGDKTVQSVAHVAKASGWRRVARDAFTLESLRWCKRRVGGEIAPARTNFSTCGLGNKVYVFGGEGADSTAFSDVFVLDLDAESPRWELLRVSERMARPPGRWGHTLREVWPSHLLLFGGCSSEGPLNDVYILDLSADPPAWRELPVQPQPAPAPRSWHGACVTNGAELVICGGCNAAGRLMSDTWRLDLTADCPRWEELSGAWAPPARLGLSLVPSEEGRIFAFGGLASAGAVRLRSQEAFTMDLRSPQPTWSYVSGSRQPSGAAQEGDAPPARLEHVAGALVGGRVLVFGGSVVGSGSGGAVGRSQAVAPWQPYVLSPNCEHPTWRRLPVCGDGPDDAWGYAACMLSGCRFILPGKVTNGALDMNELNELTIFGGHESGEALGAAGHVSRWSSARAVDGGGPSYGRERQFRAPQDVTSSRRTHLAGVHGGVPPAVLEFPVLPLNAFPPAVFAAAAPAPWLAAGMLGPVATLGPPPAIAAAAAAALQQHRRYDTFLLPMHAQRALEDASGGQRSRGSNPSGVMGSRGSFEGPPREPGQNAGPSASGRGEDDRPGAGDRAKGRERAPLLEGAPQQRSRRDGSDLGGKASGSGAPSGLSTRCDATLGNSGGGGGAGGSAAEASGGAGSAGGMGDGGGCRDNGSGPRETSSCSSDDRGAWGEEHSRKRSRPWGMAVQRTQSSSQVAQLLEAAVAPEEALPPEEPATLPGQRGSG